jgi:ribosomal protein L11 methylase PrmA
MQKMGGQMLEKEATRPSYSFRDPAGYVFEDEGRIMRAISEFGATEFDLVLRTGLFDRLVSTGRLLEFRHVSVDPKTLPRSHGYHIVQVIEHPRIPFLSYPFEWPFLALRKAALAHLELQLGALEQDVVLRDASAYNIQYLGTRPIFIDHLSFRKYRQGEFWLGHDQFCREFFAPLIFEAFTGVSPANWYRGSVGGLPAGDVFSLLPLFARTRPSVLFHLAFPMILTRPSMSRQSVMQGHRPLPKRVYRWLLENLRSTIAKLKPPHKTSMWIDYPKECSYSSDALKLKRGFIAEAVSKARPKQVLDIGCNIGEYSLLTLQAGASMVIGIDFDRPSVERAFEVADEQSAALLPLNMDVSNPSPDQGWCGTQLLSLRNRNSADLVLALAIVHHLAFRHNIPVQAAIEGVVALAPAGIIEFIPRDDQEVLALSKGREYLLRDYSETIFRGVLSQNNQIIREMVLPGSGRVLCYYERRK